MEKIAGEIADCGNVCDMYAKKGLVGELTPELVTNR